MDDLSIQLSQAELVNVKAPWNADIKDVIVNFPDYIAQLLLCNLPPTDEELPLVAAYLQEAIETLFEVQENLRSLEQGGLDEDPTDIPVESPQSSPLLPVTKKIDAARIILSPVRRIPLEIIVEIALFCHSEPQDLDTPLAARVPMRLCQVSSVWRRSIESYTRLWAHIQCNPGEGPNTQFFESTLQRYTELAATAPIHLDLVLTPTRQHSRYKNDRFASRTIFLLTRWSGRLKMTSLSINFGLGGINPFTKIAGQMRFGSLPNLQSLSFHAPHQISSVSVFKQIFMNTPSLSHLHLESDQSLSNFDIIPQSMMQSLVWIEMKGRYFAVAQWTLLMVGCLKLQFASFDLDGSRPVFEQTVRITEAGDLTTLTLNFRSTCLYNPYLPFRWMSFPRLTTLNIHLNAPSLPRPRMPHDNYRPKLPSLTHLSIIANISRGLWSVADDGEASVNVQTDTSLEDIQETVRRLLTLARKDLDMLQLSLSAPLKIWNDIFSIWTSVYDTGLNSKDLPAIKTLYVGIPAEAMLQGCGQHLLQFAGRQLHHPRCKLEHLKVTIGVEKYEGQEKVDQAIDILWRGLEAYVDSNKISWEHDVLRYQPAIARNANRNAMR